MTIRKLASEIAKREGKKSQARIGDIREILGILSDLVVEEHRKNGLWSISFIYNALFDNGVKRERKKKKT